MNISTVRLVWSGICGAVNPFGSVAQSVSNYVIGKVREAVNAWLAGVGDSQRERAAAVLVVSSKALHVLQRLDAWVPARWRARYLETLEAVDAIHDAFLDFNISEDEVARMKKEINEAYLAWKGN